MQYPDTVLRPFTFARTPEIHFGEDALNSLPALASRFGRRALVLTGASSLKKSGNFKLLSEALPAKGLDCSFAQVSGEPSPESVDTIAGQHREAAPDVVIAVGGGSVIDTGKAVSAMIPVDSPVADYLEGVGTREHPGTTVPFIAVPTTAGTGTEATKNAVLSRVGAQGFKKSLRHDNFVPDIALVDPSLTLSCRPRVTAACGMDALTQLVEAYVSTKATPFTDSLALPAVGMVLDSLEPACGAGSGDIDVRSALAYAALVSGIALANAGLGVIHGLASPLGGRFSIPHGVACGTLLAEAVKATVEKLRAEGNAAALNKFAQLGTLASRDGFGDGTDAGIDMFIARLFQLTDSLALPRLGEFGIHERDLNGLAAEAGNKNNPAALDTGEIRQVLAQRL